MTRDDPKKPKHPERRKPGAMAPGSEDHLQGEGDRDAARRYNDRARNFVASGRVDEAAREAAAPPTVLDRARNVVDRIRRRLESLRKGR